MNKKTLLSIALLVAVIATGVALSGLGRPYNTAVFTLHKIISVASIVLTFIMIRRHINREGASPAAAVLSVALAVSALALLATGALMSVDIGPYALIRSIHAYVPIATAALLVASWLTLNKTAQPQNS